MILFLVGYAGSGKSSLAKRLSRKLGVVQLDTDKLVEQQEGASIADIFFYQGEEYFRHAERAVVEELVLSGYDGIVATGGGLPTWGDNMSRLNEVGYTVYLKRSPEQILSRLSDYGRERRPMFRGKSDEQLLEFMHEQMAVREPFYSEAKLVVDCNTMSDDDIVMFIVNSMK